MKIEKKMPFETKNTLKNGNQIVRFIEYLIKRYSILNVSSMGQIIPQEIKNINLHYDKVI